MQVYCGATSKGSGLEVGLPLLQRAVCGRRLAHVEGPPPVGGCHGAAQSQAHPRVRGRGGPDIQ